jgi:hypothetical protein
MPMLLVVMIGSLVSWRAARADDGVLEIDQACVAAGCFPGDTGGFPVQITAPGSYFLTSNLVVPDSATTAVTVSGDNVVLDLGGFEISGPTVCPATPPPFVCTNGGAGVGINAGPTSAVGTVVRNGSVRGFGGSPEGGTGCVAVFGTGMIEDLVVSSCNGLGVFLNHGTVQRTVVTRTASTGIAAQLGAVTESYVDNVSASGITLLRGNVLDSFVFHVGAVGIFVSGGSVAGNYVSGAGGAFAAAGISCENCNVNDNQVSDVTGVGIRTEGAATVIGNSVVASTGFGISASGSTGYGLNNLNGNNGGMAQVGGVGSLFQIDENVCQGDTICP